MPKLPKIAKIENPEFVQDFGFRATALYIGTHAYFAQKVQPDRSRDLFKDSFSRARFQRDDR